MTSKSISATTPIIFSLFASDKALTTTIQQQLGYELGQLTQHQFPDNETLIQIHSQVDKRAVIFISSLDNANPKLLPLLFAAETVRALGASKVTLIAPYLAYMRQDKQFEPGQGVTSTYFAKLLSTYVDELITIDPHLHRWHSLNELYTIPSTSLSASTAIARWIHQHVQQPILIGPDAESIQWVKEIATKAQAPFLILQKTRQGDRAIKVSIPEVEQYRSCIPVLVDDIISTGMTMLGTIRHLEMLKMPRPICIGVHAIFAGDTYQKLLASPIDKLITCNTIQHASNQIDISAEIITFLKQGPDENTTY